VLELNTARLILRGWRAGDREPFALLNADPEVTRYLGDGQPLTRAQSDELADRVDRDFAEQGFGLWAVEFRGENKFIGFVGLAYPNFLPEVLPTVEIGWRLARPFWGQGLATEGARACLAAAFDSLGQPAVCSIHDPRNIGSRRVMEKIGLHFDRDTVHPLTGRPLSVRSITRAEYEAQET
jgi:RimJ/RimL family protein N-acetyltransferase